MDIAHFRKEYTQNGLDETQVPKLPLELFQTWLDQAIQIKLSEPNAMSLATVSKDGQPNVRTVLLKAFDSKGFVFFTNYKSQKACEIADNPKAALLFNWLDLERQIKIQGSVDKISHAESLKYFLSRPIGSRLGAWVSHQSEVIPSRKLLEMKLQELKQKFSDGEVPLPDFWGGYRVAPQRIEFWQGRENRLHDRIQYTATEAKAWTIERLSP